VRYSALYAGKGYNIIFRECSVLHPKPSITIDDSRAMHAFKRPPQVTAHQEATPTMMPTGFGKTPRPKVDHPSASLVVDHVHENSA
jgi:hypothetical protein